MSVPLISTVIGLQLITLIGVVGVSFHIANTLATFNDVIIHTTTDIARALSTVDDLSMSVSMAVSEILNSSSTVSSTANALTNLSHDISQISSCVSAVGLCH